MSVDILFKLLLKIMIKYYKKIITRLTDFQIYRNIQKDKKMHIII